MYIDAQKRTVDAILGNEQQQIKQHLQPQILLKREQTIEIFHQIRKHTIIETKRQQVVVRPKAARKIKHDVGTIPKTQRSQRKLCF